MFDRICIFLIVFSLQSTFLSSQTVSYYTAYRTSFLRVTSCSLNQYFDTALLQCSNCPSNAAQKSTDFTQCDCSDRNFYYGVNQGGGSIMCLLCGSNQERTTDGFGCVNVPTPTCSTTNLTQILSESTLLGEVNGIGSSSRQPRVGDATCETCADGTLANVKAQRCSPCASTTPHLGNPPTTIACCSSTELQDGICLKYIRNGSTTIPTPDFLNRFQTRTISTFFQTHLEAALLLCRMNLNSSTVQNSPRQLLSNVTACHLLANIAAMQFYYPADNSAYDLYERFIWQSTLGQIWTSSSTLRPAIPFLAYPTTYYSEITNSSYNWIPASFQSNNLIRIKLAKYSATGEYLGFFDAFDSHLQLCGHGYTDGRPAFTFGTVFNRTCSIRVDTIWNSSMYETTFFEPYIVFSQSNADQLIPTPVVIRNYRTATSTPNQNDDESQWVYHRRFFLFDRLSGFSDNQLKNVHYAKSIKFFTRLVGGTSYIQPPILIIEYGELSQSDLNQEKIVSVSFASEFQMDLTTHIRDIWIAIGVLAGCGIFLALFQTCIWYRKAGKQTLDLLTIGKFFLKLCNIIATVFFIVMAGVSMWWLVFFKRVDAVFYVIPTSIQQASFTSLVVIAFALKTLDILQLIIRQARADIFFIDWEKAKSGNRDDVSIWRSYFVANEFNELQTFRRLNLTFHLIFVLFLLKVINLEYVASAQPNSNLFPTTADYQATYNGILRVGIAFSMWLATALVQYLVYVILYERFVENKVINFLDLCSMSNISVFILMENLYGYYLHGRSPHGVADIDMKEMLTNFKREKEELIGRRGLEANSEEQMFIVKISQSFRSQFDNLVQSYRNRILNRAIKKEEEHESQILMNSYRTINDFLCGFIDRTLPLYNYSIRTRSLAEKLIGWQLTRPRSGNSDHDDSLFLIDKDRNFTDVIFAGHENSLFIWNMSTFLFIDYFASNYVLAAIITYLLNEIIVKIRLTLGRRNISEKTLIPKNFLI